MYILPYTIIMPNMNSNQQVVQEIDGVGHFIQPVKIREYSENIKNRVIGNNITVKMKDQK